MHTQKGTASFPAPTMPLGASGVADPARGLVYIHGHSGSVFASLGEPGSRRIHQKEDFGVIVTGVTHSFPRWGRRRTPSLDSSCPASCSPLGGRGTSGSPCFLIGEKTMPTWRDLVRTREVPLPDPQTPPGPRHGRPQWLPPLSAPPPDASSCRRGREGALWVH